MDINFLYDFIVAQAFYAVATVILLGALAVVFLPNIVHAVLMLAVTFIAVAGLFLLLDAPFIAAVMVFVYAGAVCLMIVFAVMLIQRRHMKLTNVFNNQLKVGGAVVALTVAVMAYFSANARWSDVSAVTAVPKDTMNFLAELLMTKYFVAFEAAAILLTMALTGAIMIAREVKANAGSTDDN
ncbi:MAG: NADH-quinone oxidoreductase subunit J [Bacillota bacterium]|jgi:NADH-quinone oxidoreductase subunit J